MIRAFLALPVGGAAAETLARRQGELPGARTVPEENLHLTLAFLGDQQEHRLYDALADVADVAGQAFEVVLDRPDLLGGRSARAIALNAAPNLALNRLQSRTETALRRAGLDFERRRFRPHVTLFRFPRTMAADMPAHIQRWLTAAAALPPVTFDADEIVLFRSTLTADGPIYDPLAHIPIETGAPVG